MAQRCHDARELGYLRPGWFILFYKFVSFFQSSTCFPLENCIWKPKFLCEIGQGHGKPAIRRHAKCEFDPRWDRSPGGGNRNPLQYSCLENLMDRGTWWTTVHRAMKSWTQWSDREHTHTQTHTLCEKISKQLWFEVFLPIPDHPKCWQTC